MPAGCDLTVQVTIAAESVYETCTKFTADHGVDDRSLFTTDHGADGKPMAAICEKGQPTTVPWLD